MKINSLKAVIGAALVAGVALSGSAENKLVVNGADGSKKEHGLADISKIKFAGDSMVVTTSAGEAAYQLSSIAKLTFDLVTTADAEIQASLNDVNVTVAGGVLTVTSTDNAPVDMRVYNIQGVAVATVKGEGSALVDLNSLAKGVYIVKANNKTIKITR